MQSALIGWLGIVIVIGAVAATLGADFFRQRDVVEAETGADPDPANRRQPGGRLFWLTVASVVLAVVAVIATVVRLASLA